MPEIISIPPHCNTCHQAEALDILPALYDTVLVPEGVGGEIATGRSLGHSLPDLEALGWIRIVTLLSRRSFYSLLTSAKENGKCSRSPWSGPGKLSFLTTGSRGEWPTILESP